MRLAVTFLALSVTVLPAQTRSRKAHSHGTGRVNIAFETMAGAPKGEIEFEAPAESIVGFEHKATSAADEAKTAAALDLLRKRFAEMVVLPPAAGCTLTNHTAKVAADEHKAGGKGVKREQHAEVQATFRVTCRQGLRGEIRFGFAKVFPGLRQVEVALLAGEQQTSVQVRNDQGVLTIGQ